MFIPIIFERVFVHPKWLAGFPSPTVYTNQTTMSSEMSGCPDTKFANGCSLLFLASRRKKGWWWYQWCLYSESCPANLQGKGPKNWVKHHWPPRKTDPHTHATLFVFQVLSFWSSNWWTFILSRWNYSTSRPTSNFHSPQKTEDSPPDWSLNYWNSWRTNLQKIKTQVEGKRMSHEKTKKTALLSIESWLFNRDPSFMVSSNPHKSPYISG